ncbi:ABC transporter permease [Telmatospirillum sp. J64-1]|uniref:ABC transporter permease n=1 Tax=Telmatospirillum sp. J64-1 TaxID=2502183 RepID=UPI00163DBC6B|nr:sugar ABC transporter permease [Telmatospirillum sp. J64-1]
MNVTSPTDAVHGQGGSASSRLTGSRRGFSVRSLLPLALVAPALAMVLLLFIYPLGYSLISAFTLPEGGLGLGNFAKALELYSRDMVFTLVIVSVSTVLIGLVAILIGGYLLLGEQRWAVRILSVLYRWPLFIPFIVAAQCMRTFLAKNGLMNNTLTELGLIEAINTTSFLDWRGIIITFVWKQAPFVTLLVAGAMAALDRATVEAARGLGAGRLRVLVQIVVPQVMPTLVVGLILSFVTMMSVLSVPMMISGGHPTMMTVDMAFRINAYGDYGTANALGFFSYLMTGAVAWIYLRRGIDKEGAK